MKEKIKELYAAWQKEYSELKTGASFDVWLDTKLPDSHEGVGEKEITKLVEQAFKSGRISVNTSYEEWYDNFGRIAVKAIINSQPDKLSKEKIEEITQKIHVSLYGGKTLCDGIDCEDCHAIRKVLKEEISLLQPDNGQEAVAIEFAKYLSENNWESSNGLMYNKFRYEYGSKYIITTEPVSEVYKRFLQHKQESKV